MLVFRVTRTYRSPPGAVRWERQLLGEGTGATEMVSYRTRPPARALNPGRLAPEPKLSALTRIMTVQPHWAFSFIVTLTLATQGSILTASFGNIL